MKKLSLIVLLLVAFVLAACAPAAMGGGYTATLSGSSEVPPVETAASGSATVTLNGMDMTLVGTYEGLSGPAQAAHIHGPAAEGANADVVIPLTLTEGSTAGSGTLAGTATLTEAQLADLQAGLYYVNVHTEANGGGEIRGQLK
jgi:CHRD domain